MGKLEVVEKLKQVARKKLEVVETYQFFERKLREITQLLDDKVYSFDDDWVTECAQKLLDVFQKKDSKNKWVSEGRVAFWKNSQRWIGKELKKIQRTDQHQHIDNYADLEQFRDGLKQGDEVKIFDLQKSDQKNDKWIWTIGKIEEVFEGHAFKVSFGEYKCGACLSKNIRKQLNHLGIDGDETNFAPCNHGTSKEVLLYLRNRIYPKEQ